MGRSKKSGPGRSLRQESPMEEKLELLPLASLWCNIQFVCVCLDTDMVIIYLSAGITSKDSSEEDKKATLRVINEENSFLNNSVMILTYALMNGR